MRVILLMAGMVALGLAGWNFNAVRDELRRSLPPKFSEEELRWVVGYHIWSPVASDAARRRFIASHLWASLFALCVGLLMLTFGELIGAALFGGLGVLAFAYITWQACRYKARKPKISNWITAKRLRHILRTSCRADAQRCRKA